MKGNISVSELAKELTANGYKIGVRSLFKKLHEHGLLWVTVGNRKEPTKQAVKSGYLVKGASEGFDKWGRWQRTIIVMVTPKGQQYIHNLFMESERKEL